MAAEFDAGTETVLLTQKSPGAANSIALSDDTTGFFAATKLASAVPTIPKYTSVSSGEEVNTTATSFTPFGPSFDGLESTALATIGAVYSGAQADDVLTFEVRNDGNIGDDTDLKIKVRDGSGSEIDEVNFRALAPDTPLTLSNGLTLSFSAGFLKKDETFQVQVFQSLGARVDPDKPFDGTRNQDPNFEGGLTVMAGSFDVNGVTIDVFAADTIRSVLDRISASGADVTASFDSGAEKVRLIQNVAGSFRNIVLDNDTSGFLAATKLNVPPSPGGQGNDADRIIATVPTLSGISTGESEVNGVSISVDVTTDTLNDVIARLNASGAGATGIVNLGKDSVTFQSNGSSDQLTLNDGTSGFFTALGIVPKTYLPAETGANKLREPQRVERALRDVQAELDEIFGHKFKGLDAELLDETRRRLRGSIAGAFSLRGPAAGVGSGQAYRSGLGIDADFRDPSTEILRLNRRLLHRSLVENLAEVTDFLFRDVEEPRQDGFVVSLLRELKRLESAVSSSLGAGHRSGLLVDVQI